MGCDTEVEREQIDKYEFNTADTIPLLPLSL